GRVSSRKWFQGAETSRSRPASQHTHVRFSGRRRGPCPPHPSLAPSQASSGAPSCRNSSPSQRPTAARSPLRPPRGPGQARRLAALCGAGGRSVGGRRASAPLPGLSVSRTLLCRCP
ncbi:unnamed protein product, partial [Gulo gulo]